jgi:hypothetical protein
MYTFYSCNLNRVTRWDYGKLRYACHNMGNKLEWDNRSHNWLLYNPETLEVYGIVSIYQA